MAKKYISLSKLNIFLDNLKNTFASLGHKHTISEITDFAIDKELSPASTNPVQNKVINDEFEAISKAFAAYESALDDKADELHNHTISDITNLQETLDEKVPTTRTVNGKSLSDNILLSASDVGADESGSASNVQANLNIVQADLTKHVDNVDIHFTTEERTKLSGIATGANKYTLPTATSSSLGGIKSGGDITVDADGNVSVDLSSVNPIVISDEEPTNENAKMWIKPEIEDMTTVPEVKDDVINNDDTWSSNKIDSEISSLQTQVDTLNTKLGRFNITVKENITTDLTGLWQLGIPSTADICVANSADSTYMIDVFKNQYNIWYAKARHYNNGYPTSAITINKVYIMYIECD